MGFLKESDQAARQSWRLPDLTPFSPRTEMTDLPLTP